MLFNLPLLSNDDLGLLLVYETKRFLDAIEKKEPVSVLREIHDNIRAIYSELNRRTQKSMQRRESPPK